MERKTNAVFLIVLLAVSLLPTLAHAEDSGGGQASETQVSLQPSQPVMGGAVDISITLFNSQSSDAYGVEVGFFKDSITPSNRFYWDTVDVFANDFHTLTATWSGLTEGPQEVWIEWFANGDTQGARVNTTFNVQGLANLRVDALEVGGTSPIYSGDTVPLSTLVLNSGSVDAPASKLLVQVPESSDVMLNTPALLAGTSAWVNTTISAPSSGVHTVEVTPDIENEVQEASENNKKTGVQLTVSTRMDLSFKDGLTVTTAEGALEGPWTVEGTLVRTDGTGPADIPLWVQLQNPGGGLITSPPFDVSFAGVGYSEQAFSVELNASTLSSLPPGDHIVVAVINPFNDAGYEQENHSNDEASGVLTISEVPDVYVDSIALPTVPSVQSGENVEWRVTVENTGDIEVLGVIKYTFDGVEGQSSPIRLLAGEARTWNTTLPTALGAHTAAFDAQWVAAQGSWDANKQNSFASGTVLVESKLKLNWEYSSLVVLDVNNEIPTMPLKDGEAYTLDISMTSQETGEANYTCQDSSNNVLSTMSVAVETRGDRVTLSCTFTAKASTTTVRLIPEDASISSTFSKSFATLATNANNGDGAGSSDGGTLAMFGMVALVLIGALVAAVILTREREEEVERDIYEYCPACDGELEGTEDRCPHCMFNLKKARSQFHDCHECGESIPDLMENCAYCGAHQDVSSFFERRERRERREVVKETVALPEEDENEIVTGTQNFADAVKEFGFDEEHLEEEWDTNIEAAEAEVEAAYDRRHADEIAMEEMTEEELEAYKSQVTTTLGASIDATPDHDIEAILASKGEIKSLGEDKGELSASDADIREQLFEITGEEGVLPGEKVKVGMSLTDSSLAGNEVSEATANFSFDDEDDVPLSASVHTDKKADSDRKKPARRRQSKEKKPEEKMDECGACGADLPAGALECGTCGARFG
ncbi:MAG: hypothetical protein CMA86_06675 [Euryarchaeota archaeon]|nr:hypothetical protein [Euryarchaeota archaeon]